MKQTEPSENQSDHEEVINVSKKNSQGVTVESSVFGVTADQQTKFSLIQ